MRKTLLICVILLALSLCSCGSQMLTEENERLQKALGTDISIVRVSRGSGKTAHLREVGRIKVDAIRAETVRKMHSEIKERCIKGGIYPAFVARTIDQITKEMLEEKNNETRK